ncbi:MAG TPA: M56 family metallopeptidase, partial [Pirellulales bacterium]|nr:M56 family metallopeptidase [Pirellulales bacterium]
MNPLAWYDESFSLPFTQTLLHFLWQGTLIAIAARGVEQVFRRGPAQAKYLLHVVALLAMACCLPVTFVLIAPSSEDGNIMASGQEPARQQRLAVPAGFDWAVEKRLDDQEQPTGTVLSGKSASTLAGDGERNDAFVTAALAGNVTQVAGTSATALPGKGTPRAGSWLSILAPYLTIAYLMGVLGLLARLAIGVWGGHRLRAATVAIADTDLLKAVARQSRQIGLRAAPVVAYCERISVPVVVGILRPMILLPAALASGLSPNQLEALIAHELAHLRRWDPLVNLVQRLVEAILFFHPAVWYISRRIRTERENASDDLVLAAGWQRVQYADALVRMAELAASLRRGEAAPYLAVAASGGSQSEFKRRVMRLLEPERTHYQLTNTGWVLFLVIVVSAIAAPVTVRTWAEQAPSDASAKAESATKDEERLGRRIDNFHLQDYLGAEHSLSDFADRDVIVVAFLGVECPVSKLYGPRLQRLAGRYQARSVAVIGIDSNQQDTPTELAHYARTHGVTFPLLKDPAGRVADQFRAERTPEAFVLDRDRKVRYWGRIDDQFGVGYARPEARQDFVANAIDDLLADRPVGTAHVDSTGCHIGRVTRVAPTGEITYTNQISRIVQRRCIECHRQGGIAPFTLDSYGTVAAWAETIREVVEDGRMPPWHANSKYGHFANDGRMPDAEKTLLYQWVANGVPKGADGDLPPPREFTDGWALGPPDLLLTMPEPITVPPTGVVDYQYVTVDPGFTEGKWVRASEIRPGVRSVVHHIVVFINPPGGDPILKERGVGFEMVGGYVPGAPPMKLDEGLARYVPPGSTFVFQIHYTPDGSEQQDRSEVGLYFADAATVSRTMQTGVAANLDFEIPPRADDFRVEASHRFSHDMELHALAPHMHYRGKSFRAEATYPNGSREILLDVPRYDFNWQNNYRFAQPKFMPEGTVLRCVGHFDNSEDNPANPDPNVAVRWGEQTWEEMMIGYFEGVFLNQDLSLPPPRITSTADGNYRAHFTYRPDRPAERVNLAGTFNKWSNSS